ncbi:hypothetical protein ACFSR7_15410 [Cohnella sp. GCM10020058]|uniref:hypothetical protein n=1 Tax=Cohnella sp. GCM10020058 TaxID=3317330 RepID=UPI00363A8ADC
MTREEIVAEMVRVAEALEKPELTDVQRARGRAKYETLEEELRELDEAEERKCLTATEPEEKKQEAGGIASAALAIIYQTLDPSGSLRARRKAKR